jgi:hypothetical protein
MNEEDDKGDRPGLSFKGLGGGLNGRKIPLDESLEMPSLESDHDSDARKDVKDTNALNYQSKQNVKNNF